jgi:CDP-diacylglycerol--serine O-phosphatidyltransferase (EC 2.7.8.8)
MNEIGRKQSPRRRRRRGIYLLPNLFTTGTLFGGFYAIVSSMGGRFDHAAIGILVAMLCDAFDGRIARLTHTSTDFGKEYDSLCDMVAFGIATAVVIYAYSLRYLSDYPWLGGKLGGAVALVYAVAAALRLARFNVHSAIADSNKDFYGLPSPAAAAVIVFFVWSCVRWGWQGVDLILPAALLTVSMAVLMVSSVRYNSFKHLALSERLRFLPFAVIIGAILLISLDPPRILFIGFLLYALSGPLLMLVQRLRARRARRRALASADARR